MTCLFQAMQLMVSKSEPTKPHHFKRSPSTTFRFLRKTQQSSRRTTITTLPKNKVFRSSSICASSMVSSTYTKRQILHFQCHRATRKTSQRIATVITINGEASNSQKISKQFISNHHSCSSASDYLADYR